MDLLQPATARASGRTISVRRRRRGINACFGSAFAPTVLRDLRLWLSACLPSDQARGDGVLGCLRQRQRQPGPRLRVAPDSRISLFRSTYQPQPVLNPQLEHV